MFKKLKNCTFTQTQLDINGAVGISLGFMLAKLWPNLIFLEWYLYAFTAILFAIPLWMSIAKQFSNDKSLKQKVLSEDNIRWMD